MYALITGTQLRLRTNDALREYARLEYGNPDAAWLLVDRSRGSRKPRQVGSLTRRIRGVFSAPAEATGLPRLKEDCPAGA